MYFIHTEDARSLYVGNVLRQKKKLDILSTREYTSLEGTYLVPRPPLGAAEKEHGRKRTDGSASVQARKSHSRPRWGG